MPAQDPLTTWTLSILSSALVGLTSIMPLIVIPLCTSDTTLTFQSEASRQKLRLLLSFAVGSLLGDVFLHLLPEAWSGCVRAANGSLHAAHLWLGIWLLAGILAFIVIEMLMSLAKAHGGGNCEESTQQDHKQLIEDLQSKIVSQDQDDLRQRNNNHVNQSKILPSNGHSKTDDHQLRPTKTDHCTTYSRTIHITGYLNILANCIDNFAHGIAVAASYLIGIKVGALTTAAIIIHEIPHEVGDFAILMRSGFSKWEAFRAQLSTASIGMLGAIFTLITDARQTSGAGSGGYGTAWILPFTAGGFLHISLVSILPEILRESDPNESLKQLGCLALGIGLMGFISTFAE